MNGIAEKKPLRQERANFWDNSEPKNLNKTKRKLNGKKLDQNMTKNGGESQSTSGFNSRP